LDLAKQPNQMPLDSAGNPNPTLLGLARPPDISNFIFFASLDLFFFSHI